MKFKKVKFISCFVFIALFGMGISRSFAQKIVILSPEGMKIDGSISYTVLGKYRAQFNAFKGRITFDDNLQGIRSVYLVIKVNSIHSNSPWCDKMVRSKKLLNTARYPEIVFKSYKIIHDEGEYKVQGVLEMHGVKRRMIFPFKREGLDIKGSWNINRKDFNIIWSKTLDHGGVLVGDIFTVDWGLRLIHRN